MIDFKAPTPPSYASYNECLPYFPIIHNQSSKIVLIIKEGQHYTLEPRYPKRMEEVVANDIAMPHVHIQMESDTTITNISHQNDIKFVGERLWIDAYTPKVFTDLITDDRVNRDLMTWLMSWIKNVAQNDVAKYPFAFKPITRDQYPCVIIYGPTSSGKTSLANIATVKCGFETLNINSFEDQEAKLFEKIHSFSENQSIFSKSRHKCIIIEGVEFLPTNLIAKLVTLIKGKTDGKTEMKKFNKPIIFICDNIHAKSIKSIKQIAYTFYLKFPQTERLHSVLNNLIIKENISIDADTLRKYIELNRNDIRGCINNLQIISHIADTKKAISSIILNESYYKKDFTRGVLDALKFLSAMKKDSNVRDIRTVSKSMGNDSLIVEGIYQNYPNSGYSDFYLAKTAELLVNQ